MKQLTSAPGVSRPNAFANPPLWLVAWLGTNAQGWLLLSGDMCIQALGLVCKNINGRRSVNARRTAGIRRCLVHTHCRVFVLPRPSSRRSCLTTRAKAYRSRQWNGNYASDGKRPWLHLVGPCKVGNNSWHMHDAQYFERKKHDQGNGRNSPCCYLKLLKEWQIFLMTICFPWGVWYLQRGKKSSRMPGKGSRNAQAARGIVLARGMWGETLLNVLINVSLGESVNTCLVPWLPCLTNVCVCMCVRNRPCRKATTTLRWGGCAEIRPWDLSPG